MPVTRRSAAGGGAPAPKPAAKSKGKRAAEGQSSKSTKRSKTEESEKKHKTIEETMEGAETAEHRIDVAQTDIKEEQNGEQNGTADTKNEGQQNGIIEGEKNAFDEVKADEPEVREAAKEEAQKSEQITNNNDSLVEDSKREGTMPSSILEKGIIYFFFRGRVNIDEPQGVDDIARSYIVLRPLPIGAKLGDGHVEDPGNARLLALPKKILPKSKRDRFLAFVEKSKTSIKDLKENFIAGNDYATKTTGISHTPAVTPIAEGVYAITSNGRKSHLAYHVTIPEPLGEVQKDIGVNEKGSYVVSVKNPTAPAPGNVSLPKGAEYPGNIMQKFRGLRWMPLEPELLDYDNTQILLIGGGSFEKAVEGQEKDVKENENEAPAEEMEKLEDEDQFRIEHLKSDDPIFADLGLSAKEYPKIQTTW